MIISWSHPHIRLLNGIFGTYLSRLKRLQCCLIAIFSLIKLLFKAIFGLFSSKERSIKIIFGSLHLKLVTSNSIRQINNLISTFYLIPLLKSNTAYFTICLSSYCNILTRENCPWLFQANRRIYLINCRCLDGKFSFFLWLLCFRI